MPAASNPVDAFFRDFGRWIRAPRVDVESGMRARIATMVHEAESRGIRIGEARARAAAGEKGCPPADLRRYLASAWECAACGQVEPAEPQGRTCVKCHGAAWVRAPAGRPAVRGRERAARFAAAVARAG